MEGSFDWDTNTAKAYTNDTITVNAITDLAAAPAFTVSDPTVLSATPNTTGSVWTIRGKSAGTATITIDTTNIQSSVSTLTVTVEDGHYLNQQGLARVWSKVKALLSGFVTADDGTTTEPVTATVSTAMIQDGAVTTAKLATGAVTADKIDWTTWYEEVTTSTSIGTSETTVLSVSNIPPGRYFVAAQAQLRGTYPSSGPLEGNSYIYSDNTQVISTFGSVTGSGVNRVQLPLSCQVVKTTTGTISLKMRGGNGSDFFTDGRTNLSIIRIG